ncbi:hypothetical protein LOTGIDRAFT_184909 [Lottia gigantea]|uniref:Alpha/beta hydrolase fold-3 domain-containing protein n=1 Tax=Lottia gigantea TaxID=225164 RepID=V4BBK1_LOTGI|nr:hypothetical protein LOTGIDRAFT_184909 [Lottia gigantea]ESP04936.1 hypothetical protein LOTGIDRAFT_184909 [Lottia gigantea]
MGLCSFQNFVIFWSAIFLGLAYFLYTPVPHGFSEPWKLRTVLAGFKTVNLIGGVSELLGYDSGINMTRKFLNIAYARQPDDPALEVWDATFDGVPVRIYKPIKIQTPAPAMVFLHGGGWVLFSIDEYDLTTRLIAKQAEIIVVSVNYRLAPEYPFPIPFDDCVTATTHLLQNGAKYGVDPKRVAVAGDSAGGNLAAAVSTKLRDEHHKPGIRLQILVYPVLQGCDWYLPSYQTGAILFNRDDKAKFVRAYVNFSKDFFPFIGTERYYSKTVREKCKKFVDFHLLPNEFIPKDYKQTELFSKDKLPKTLEKDFQKAQKFLSNPYIFPLMLENLKGLPPTFILSVEYDTLRDENIIFVSRLQSAGVDVVRKHFDQCIHGCFNLRNSSFDFSDGKRMIQTIVDYLKEKL